MDTNIVVLDNVRTNYVTPFSFVDEGKKIGEGFVLPLTKYEQQGETEERERDAGMPEIVAPPPAATQTILSGIPNDKWIFIFTKRHEILVFTANVELPGHLSRESMFTFRVKQNFIMRHEK